MWLAPASSFWTQLSNWHFPWTGLYPASSVPATFISRALHHIRPRLTLDAAKSVAVSIVSVRLDYSNSLLYGTSHCNLDHHLSVFRTHSAVR